MRMGIARRQPNVRLPGILGRTLLARRAFIAELSIDILLAAVVALLFYHAVGAALPSAANLRAPVSGETSVPVLL